jgi:diadenylate cyclase
MLGQGGLASFLRQVVPGTQLRDGLDRIVQAKMGALIVVGDTEEVMRISTGGFPVNSDVTPQRLFELAKMDGAIILSRNAKRITKANAHLVPDASIPTTETGTRHRTAERVAKALNVPVIAVSDDRGTITVYLGQEKRMLRSVQYLWNRANQLMQTLERFKQRFDESVAALSSSEVADIVTLRDVATVLQRAEMVRRVAQEVEADVAELGREGALLAMQLKELTRGVEDEERLVIEDYLAEAGQADRVIARLESLGYEQLLDPAEVASQLVGVSPHALNLQQPVSSKGRRILSHIPSLPSNIVDAIVRYFGTLQRIMKATEDDLGEVEGVGEARARSVKEGLARITEASIMERYR